VVGRYIPFATGQFGSNQTGIERLRDLQDQAGDTKIWADSMIDYRDKENQLSTPDTPAAAPTAADPGPAEAPAGRRSVYPRVFYPSALLIFGFVLWAIFASETAEERLGNARDWISQYLGWYYVLIVAAFIIFALVVGLSHFGNIKLGPDDEKPEFSMKAWLAMLFSAGMGIGLVFWGVAEPLSHYASPRPSWEGGEAEIGQQAMLQTYLHWGLHAWGIYVIVGLAIAYAVHRRGRPVSIRWALEPVLGKHVRGWLGDLIDIVALVGTIFGIATSLGLGVLQIGAGMEWLGWVEDPSNLVMIMLIGAITSIAVLSVVTGIKRGIKWLSQTNVSLAGALLVFVLIAGPTLLLLQDFIQSTGGYLQNLLFMSFDVGAAEGAEGRKWAAGWTTFYWGWWISWAAFVGIFIARISRGRTVREFVAGVLLLPTAVSFLWFTVMGGSALHRVIDEGDTSLLDQSVDGMLFGLLDTLPAGTFIIIGTLLVIAIFFVTSSDSGSLVVDMLASGGDPDPPTWSRVFWAVLEGVVAIVLLLAGGLVALQAASIAAAVPVSIVMIVMCVAIWRQFSAERHAMVELERKELAQAMIDDGLVEGNGNGGDKAGAGAGRG
jgi:choline/glycine/proline betaine transport protein